MSFVRWLVRMKIEVVRFTSDEWRDERADREKEREREREVMERARLRMVTMLRVLVPAAEIKSLLLYEGRDISPQALYSFLSQPHKARASPRPDVSQE